MATGSAKHPPTNPPVSEQDPRAWWDALVEAVTQLGDRRADIVAVSVAGQQHGLVLLDEAGAPLRPAKLWNDTTSAEQADRLVAGLGAETWAERTGSVPVAAFTVTKLAWVAEHEPELIARVGMVMLPHDYLTWRLAGEHVTDRGRRLRQWLVRPVERERADRPGRPRRRWLGVVRPGARAVLGPTDPAGTITGESAAALGLPSDVVIGPGTGDNMGAALGLGLRSGDVAISLGTSGTVFAVSDSATHDPSGAVAGFASATRQLPAARVHAQRDEGDRHGRSMARDRRGRPRRPRIGCCRRPGNCDARPLFRWRTHPEPSRRDRNLHRSDEHDDARPTRARCA